MPSYFRCLAVLGKKRFRRISHNPSSCYSQKKLPDSPKPRGPNRLRHHPARHRRQQHQEQYEKGPKIAAQILNQIGCADDFIRQVCSIVGTHHDHPEEPSESFRILYDSDKLVMFSAEEFPVYDSRPGFDWNKITDLIYSPKGKQLATETLKQRRKEKRSQH